MIAQHKEEDLFQATFRETLTLSQLEELDKNTTHLEVKFVTSEHWQELADRICELPALKSLILSFCYVEAGPLTSIAKCHQLTELTIGNETPMLRVQRSHRRGSIADHPRTSTSHPLESR